MAGTKELQFTSRATEIARLQSTLHERFPALILDTLHEPAERIFQAHKDLKEHRITEAKCEEIEEASMHELALANMVVDLDAQSAYIASARNAFSSDSAAKVDPVAIFGTLMAQQMLADSMVEVAREE